MIVSDVGHALSYAFGMLWEILWALILGFTLSGVVQAVVHKGEMRRLLPDDSPRSILIAGGLGAASSSCSYAAVALARSLFRKGADFTAAMAFEFASTNLVIELGIIMAVVLGWQFTAGELVGGPVMIVLLVLIFRVVLSKRDVEQARAQADRGVRGQMEGHADMDMSVHDGDTVWERLRSPRALTAISSFFVMDWASVIVDILAGLLISGGLAAWVPDSFWRGLFLAHHHALSLFWGPVIAPLVAMISFVCSVGNVPLAAVLWNGGISFGGVLSFVFADLIILPIIDIYRRYYGWRIALLLASSFYVTMVTAGLIVEFLFRAAGIARITRNAHVQTASIHWNYTTYLNIVFLTLAAVLLWRFIRSGGLPMLKMMNNPMQNGYVDHGHGAPG